MSARPSLFLQLVLLSECHMLVCLGVCVFGCVSHQSLINTELICVLSMLLCQSLPVDTLVRLCVSHVCRGVCISLIVDVCMCVCVCIGVVCMFWSLCMVVNLSPGVYMWTHVCKDRVCQGLCMHRCFESWCTWHQYAGLCVCWCTCRMCVCRPPCVSMWYLDVCDQ